MSRQKVFGLKWWTYEWLYVLGLLDPERMERAQAYVSSGKVMKLDIRQNKVLANVRGSRIKPYSVTVQFKAWPIDRLKHVYPKLKRTPGRKQFLEINELPSAWRAHFASMDLRLIPDPEQMSFVCSCPDWSWPCKHALAVCCQLSVQMESDPMLLLRLQGLDPESILNPVPEVHESDPIQIHRFWTVNRVPKLNLREAQTPDLLLKRLGPIPGALSEKRLLQALWPVYEAVGKQQSPEENTLIVPDGD